MHKYQLPSHTIRAALAATALLLAQAALAQDFIKGGEEKYTLRLGGIVNQFDTNVTINGTAGTGTPVNLEGNGMKQNMSSLDIGGSWRFADRHRLDFTYFSANRSGSRKYDRNITVGDKVFQAGFDVNAEAKSDFLILDYRYSMYKSDALEFAGVLGFYGGKFNFDVNGTVAVSGGGGATGSASKSSSTTVPLPLIGASLDWYIQPRWKASTSLEGMKAKIGSVDGTATFFTLGTEYMLARNWGLGMSYMYTKVKVDATSSGFNGTVDWGSNAVVAYATMKF